MATTSIRARKAGVVSQPTAKKLPASPNVPAPCPADVPDWSQETLAAFDELTALEVAFVQWIATGLSAAAAYQKAAGNKLSNRRYARQYAHALRRRPRVQQAIDLALKDRNFSARFDREWKLQRLGSIVDQSQESGSLPALRNIPAIICTMAKLQGELDGQQPAPTVPVTQVRESVTQRIKDILDSVAKLNGDSVSAEEMALVTASSVPVAQELAEMVKQRLPCEADESEVVATRADIPSRPTKANTDPPELAPTVDRAEWAGAWLPRRRPTNFLGVFGIDRTIDGFMGVGFA